MMVRFLLPATAAVLLFLPSGSQAAKVKVWHHNSPAHYEKARLKHTVVSSEGFLRLSRQLKPLASVEATHVWDVVEDKAGNLFAATGDEGKVYKVTPEGKLSVASGGEDSQILSLALAHDGTVYAGTGPGGLVLQIPPNGPAKVLYKSPEMYIWCLAVSPDGQTIYAGTGPKGRIYELTAAGKARVFYTTRQEHILSLALASDGTLYAGTDKNGVVYRINRQGKGFVLYSTPQTEVRSLLATADGIYAGTSSPTRRRPGSPSTPAGNNPLSPSTPRAPGTPAASEDKDTKPAADKSATALAPSSSSAAADAFEKSNPAPSSPPPAIGENSLYRIAPDGTVRELFREKALVLSLLRQNGHIFIGTGMEGQLFEVDEASRERSEIARLDHGQIHALCRRRDGSIVVATGDPGKLYVLQDKYAPCGTVVSDVLDAKLISKWGSLRWKAETPPGTSVSLAVRSGNTSDPDETWSNWSAEQTDGQQAIIAAPAARFLQYRITLSTKDPTRTPALHSLALRYMTANQAPEVTNIQVPDLDAVNLDNPKKLRFKWSATDPNEDDLTYTLYLRKDGWKNWIELEDNLERTDYEWDTTTAPSGLYQIKVVASDRKENPVEDALTGERISGSFVVAHELPMVSLKTAGMDGDQAIVEATATDPLVRLTAAMFSVNGKKWINVFPTDGLFDSRNELFRFKTDSLKPGTYVVVLRVRDAAGNIGSGDVVFTVKAEDVKP